MAIPPVSPKVTSLLMNDGSSHDEHPQVSYSEYGNDSVFQQSYHHPAAEMQMKTVPEDEAMTASSFNEPMGMHRNGAYAADSYASC